MNEISKGLKIFHDEKIADFSNKKCLKLTMISFITK